MSHSLTKILIHATFRTNKHHVLIPRQLWEEHFAYLHGVLDFLESPAIQVGGVEDHIHVCFRLSKNAAVSSVMGKLKANSSRWLKEKGLHNFSWKSGYGAFSISQSHVDRVVRYIQRQEAHHRRVSYREELVTFLEKYEMECHDFTLQDPDL
jgi:putative transposase